MSNEKGKLPEVTDEEWGSFNKPNRKIIEDFLKQKGATLSPATIKQYTSALKHFARWIHTELDDSKKITDLKPRHALQYITYLSDAGLSPAAIKFKVASASSLCLYLVRYYDDEYPNFKNIFTGVEKPPKNPVHQKQPLTKEELSNLINKLEEMGEWQILAYLKFSFSTGCRREEARQLLKEITGYERVKDKNYYLTHTIRCKGRGKDGKQRKLVCDDEAMDAIKKWLGYRGNDDCPYVFVTKENGKYRQLSANTFNYWCSKIIAEIVGRRVHPHMIRSSRATTLSLEDGKDIKGIQQLLGHQDSSTTEIYIVRDHSNDVDDVFS